MRERAQRRDHHVYRHGQSIEKAISCAIPSKGVLDARFMCVCVCVLIAYMALRCAAHVPRPFEIGGRSQWKIIAFCCSE